MSKKRKREALAAELADLHSTPYSAPSKRKRNTKAPVQEEYSDSDDISYEKDSYDDQFIGGAEDYEYLNGLTAIQREVVIAQRREDRKEMEKRNADKKAKAREMRASDGEPPSKKSRKSKLDALAQKARDKKRSSSSYYDKEYDYAESEGEEEYRQHEQPEGREWDTDKADKRDWNAPESEPVLEQVVAVPSRSITSLEHHDLLPVVVRRETLEKWYGEPYWSKVTNGLFVRVSAEKAYRIGQIVGFVGSEIGYRFGKKMIHEKVVVKYSGRTHNYQMKFISNGYIRPEEFMYWKTEFLKTEDDDEDLTRTDIKILSDQIQFAREYVYTNADVKKKVEENLRARRDPVHLSKMKFKLMEDLDHLKMLPETPENVSQIEQIEKKLEEMRKLAEEKQQREAQHYQVKLSSVNKKNAVRNQKFNNVNRENTLRMQTAELSGKSSSTSDPFKRRNTRVDHAWISEAGKKRTDESGETAAKQPEVDEKAIAKKQREDRLKETEKKMMASLAKITTPSKSVPVTPSSSSRSTLSFADYMKRKA